MKRVLLTVICLSGFAMVLQAASWTAKSNTDLRNDMLYCANNFRKQVVGEEIYNDLTEFICEVIAVSSSEPYAWMKQTHKFVTEQLRRYPACLDIPLNSKEKHSIIRKYLLYLRDYPMHVNNSSSVSPAPASGQTDAFNQACDYYLSDARAEFLRWLDSPAPTKDNELQMFKVYNMGFAFRTSKHLILTDIKWHGTDAEAAYIASKADAIFLTHNHSDHYSQVLLNEMAKANKSLVMPVDKVPTYTDNSKKIVKTTNFDAVELDGITVQGFMGVQNGVDNLLYAIEMDGWRICHGGDNQEESAESNFQNLEGFDIATIAIFARPQRILNYIMVSKNQDKRDLVFLSAHENEQGHEVSGRIGFNQAYEEPSKFANSSFDYPACLILDNGETVTFTK